MKTVNPLFHARICECTKDFAFGGHGAHWTDTFYVYCTECGERIEINVNNPLWKAIIGPLWLYLFPVLDVSCKCGKDYCRGSKDFNSVSYNSGGCRRHGPPGTEPGTAIPIHENHHEDGTLMDRNTCGWVLGHGDMKHD